MKIYLAALIIFLFAPFVVFAQNAPDTPDAPLEEVEVLVEFGPPEPLIVETQAGPVQYMVEFANTDPQRQQGMMFRESMGEGTGMLFDFVEPRPVSMWMKNTLIPLDIIFINAEGRVISIARNARPKSLRSIPSGGITKAVLEIAGGAARKNGIARGDLIRHSMFENIETPAIMSQNMQQGASKALPDSVEAPNSAPSGVED